MIKELDIDTSELFADLDYSNRYVQQEAADKQRVSGWVNLLIKLTNQNPFFRWGFSFALQLLCSVRDYQQSLSTNYSLFQSSPSGKRQRTDPVCIDVCSLSELHWPMEKVNVAAPCRKGTCLIVMTFVEVNHISSAWTDEGHWIVLLTAMTFFLLTLQHYHKASKLLIDDCEFSCSCLCSVSRTLRRRDPQHFEHPVLISAFSLVSLRTLS